MGQIQNAVLNTLGSVQQMVQLYKLTDAYADKQESKAKERAEKEAKQRFEEAEEKRLRNRTAGQAKEDILSTPLTEEENKKFSEAYNYAKDYTPQQLKKLRNDLKNSIDSYVGDFRDPKYVELIREREWFRQNHPTADERKELDKKAKAQKSPQEQADTNDNIARAKNAAKGGKK